ncbi:hypothetical protein A0H76_1368 [Hepatospora eriocheir]|uniref:Uncharacterized protein n=1 Tax=Hepatospora eriocheir TaxID=1081669 RepID=A0A1X0QLG4_9MICR|nr:hypothetical protein HERIO_1843 [Hepatospora eriocheir]ORE00622.1 hypothetical protein A0H76_1368 [Hepatospora eriocheir]
MKENFFTKVNEKLCKCVGICTTPKRCHKEAVRETLSELFRKNRLPGYYSEPNYGNKKSRKKIKQIDKEMEVARFLVFLKRNKIYFDYFDVIYLYLFLILKL